MEFLDNVNKMRYRGHFLPQISEVGQEECLGFIFVEKAPSHRFNDMLWYSRHEGFLCLVLSSGHVNPISPLDDLSGWLSSVLDGQSILVISLPLGNNPAPRHHQLEL